MAGVVWKWKFFDLVKVIVATLLNKYDFFCVIEGNTGVGKSTLAFQIAKGVSREFKRLYDMKEEYVMYYYQRVGIPQRLTLQEFIQKILDLKEKKAYRFNPNKVLVYSQDDFQKSLATWNTLIIPDELIASIFNRDFYGEKQKDIIKMVNMFRDHCNLSIGCVPSFSNIDNQIRGLTKMKLTCKKRGMAIVHTPNKVIYSKDKWDQTTNEKIEREWIAKKIAKPNYSKLTTFRGVIQFPPLSKKEEVVYQEIKNRKRAVILKSEMGVDLDEKKDDPVERFIDKLIAGGVKNNHVLNGLAMAMDMKEEALRSKIVRRLREMNKPTALSYYFWDKKSKNEELEAFQSIN